ncbi:MAG TPA: MASE1 domain-containing protein [Anaeromyxobacteraceae bacterium]|nr:MASE1 domain-containing protein [Anaeromyxobacteraceae bacterium]
MLALAVTYAAIGRAGLAIAPVHDFATLVWPPTGIALAALLRLGLPLWPGVAAGALAVNLWTGAQLPVALGIATGNTLEAVVGAHLLRRVVGRAPSLATLPEVLAFILLSAAASTAISATLGVSSLIAGGRAPAADLLVTWRAWWLGDLVGNLVVGAWLLALTAPRPPAFRARGRNLEGALLGAAIVAATVLVFLRTPATPAAGFVQACSLLPIVILAALRLELRGATTATLLASVVAIAATASGRGPFVEGSLSGSLVSLQAFMAIAASAVLLVCAVTAERREALRLGHASAQALRERERELQLVADATPLMLTRCSRDLRYLFVNRAYAAMIGRTPEEIVGRPIVEVMGAQGFEGVRPRIEAVLAGRRVEYDEPVHFAGTGVRHLHVMYVPDIGDRGEVVGWLASIVDHTDRKLAEEAVREADRRKSEFLAVLSHELRNPLTPIRNALHVLRRVPDGSERAIRARAVIERQTIQLTRLVDDLLDMTRISKGKIQLRRRRVPVGELVRNVVNDHRPVFEARRIEVDLHIDPGPLWVDGDDVRLAQIVGNLVQNAAKFTNAGGHVAVRVERAGASHVSIRVADDGIGIDPAIMKGLFEPFTQADKSLDRSAGGLGLGLAVARALVEMHGGRIEVSSPGPGRGSAFAVSLPLATDAAVEPGAARSTAAAPTPRRVLVIEDNVDGAEMLRESLELALHEVAVAHSGEEGLAKARVFRPEVVVCDVGLPGLDGYEVARRIRADPALSPALIAVTGYALPEDRARAREAGFDLHLAKPFDLAVLEDLVQRLGARPAPSPLTERR